MQHLGGYAPRATHDVKLYMAVACFACYPCESALLEILEDDRVLRNRESLERTLQEEVEYVTAVPEYTWRRLADLVGGASTAGSVRDAAIRSACTSVGYVHRELFL